MPGKLPRSVLLALGLTAGCQQCGKTHIGPCLSIAPDPDPNNPHVGPCLSPVEPPEPPPRDTGVAPCLSEVAPEDPPEQPPDLGVCLSIILPEHVGPCLDFPVEPPEPPEPPIEPCLEYISEPEPEPAPEPAGDDGKGGKTGSIQGVRDRVLARGVLPEDVAALLRRG